MSGSVVFFGSSPLSVIVLKQLINSGTTISAVVTNPDKPAGRGLKLTPNPVKSLALANNIPFIETMNDLMTINDNRMTNTIGLVAAYGRIIPQSILDNFNNQIFNIHPSILPKYRGASPLQQQILDGITETGVTLIQLDAQMDHGPIVAVETDTILPDDTWITLGQRLFDLGANLFLNEILCAKHPQRSRFDEVEVGSSRMYLPQNEVEASYTKKITKQSGFIPWPEFEQALALSPMDLALERKLRAFAGWPGVWSLKPDGTRVILKSISPLRLLSVPV